MKLTLNKFKLFLLSAVILLIPNQMAFADSTHGLNNVADSSIKTAVESDFSKYQKTLDNAKQNFGKTGDETYAAAHLEDGTPYYVATENGKDFVLDGYIFPIELNGKPSGIVFAKQIGGHWAVFNIKNNLSFDQDIKDIKGLLKKNDDAKLIYDPALSMYSVAVHHETGEDELISMKEDTALGLHKNQAVKLKDVQEKLQKIQSERKLPADNNGAVQAGGPGSGQSQSNYLKMNLGISASVIVVLSLMTIFLIKRRKSI
jgi:hypothetical protein